MSHLQEIIERGFQTLPDLLAGPGEAERPRGLLNQALEVDSPTPFDDDLKRLAEMFLRDRVAQGIIATDQSSGPG